MLDARRLQALSSLLREGAVGFGASTLAGPLGAPPAVLPSPAALAGVLPDGGWPLGSVVELASPANLGQGASLALAACAASQAASRAVLKESAWCAFVDSYRTLHASAVERSGVSLPRFLLVRPPEEAVARVAVKLAVSRLFSVIVVDGAACPGARLPLGAAPLPGWMRDGAKFVRRLSLALESSQSIVLLLTDGAVRRSLPLPVAMRLELERGRGDSLLVRVAKERSGRVSGVHRVLWEGGHD